MDVGRLFTRGQVLPAFLPARSETVWSIGPFSRTCLRHLTFHGSGTPRQKKKMAQMKEQIKAPEKNTTKQRKDSQPIRCTVQNTGNQDAHRIG